MKYRCVTCDEEFDSIPDGAIQLTSERHRVSSYRFSEGTVHHLRRSLGLSANHRWHKTPRPDCVFCFPKQNQPSPPVVEQLLVQALVPEPQIMVEVKPEPNEIEPEPEPVEQSREESELASITTMSRAFGRMRK